jgi:polar amino acid transport system substrate-binding protein
MRAAQLIVAALLSAAVLPLCAAEVSIRADEWYPINGEPNSERPGIMIELASAILGKAGHTVDYQLMAWDDAIARTKKGEFDCVVGALEGEAEGFVYPKEPWVLSAQTLYVRDDRSFTYTSIDDLSKLKVAVIDAYSYGDTLDGYIATNRNDPSRILLVRNETKPLRSAMTRVLVGQADAVLETSVVMDATLASSGFKNKLRRLAPALRDQTEKLYIACSPARASSKTYVELFNTGLTRMRADGSLNALLARYGRRDGEI